jgi:hypothetical protein
MTDVKRFSLVKPTLNTPFHIDFDWWKEHDNNWRVYLHSYLCPEHQASFSSNEQNTDIDWVDPETAEVRTVDGLLQVLITHCAKLEGFVNSNTTLVDAVFRVLLAHGNQPMTPNQLSAVTNKPAETILRTFGSTQVYKGIRPKNI